MARQPSTRLSVRGCQLWCVGAGLAGLLLIASAFNTPAQAQVARAQDNARISASFDALLRVWMTEHQVPAASLAATKDGQLITTLGYGGMDANRPERIASLSKAITGVCIARLVDEGRLSFTTRLGMVLANAFRRFGQAVDPRFNNISIEQLLMHRAGLAREAAGPRAQHMAGHFMSALATPLADAPGGTMSYSNIGYLTLGEVVEALTCDYEKYCNKVALAPMRASGSIDAALRARAPNGGWRVSAVDYARFLQVFDPGPAGLGSAARSWLESRNEDPLYGLGVQMRRTAHGLVLSHSGRVAARERGGAYFIKFDSGWTVVVAFAGDPGRDSTRNLRQRLEAAVPSL
jgi:CubicO group peptidase (beta-lactamase class C family)